MRRIIMSNTTNNPMAEDFDRSNFFMNGSEQVSLEKTYTGYDIFSCPSAGQADSYSWSELQDPR